LASQTLSPPGIVSTVQGGEIFVRSFLDTKGKGRPTEADAGKKKPHTGGGASRVPLGGNLVP
jgi:hypothetical protein